MLTNTTAEKLREMHLNIMAGSFTRQIDDGSMKELPFEDRFGLIVDAEWATRKSKRLTRLIRAAGYVYPNACLEDIEYRADRGLDKAMITRLSTCTYIKDHHNVIILGATGSGKTYLANALGMTASRSFYTVRYIRLPDLLGELALARVENKYRNVMKVYKSVNLLILDEWLLYPLKDIEARDLLEIAEGRYKKGSTIFCSQFDVVGWHQKIGDVTLAPRLRRDSSGFAGPPGPMPSVTGSSTIHTPL